MKRLIVMALLLSIAGAQVDYNLTIQPIFDNYCTGCHISGHSSGLNLTSYAEMIKGGNSGVVVKAGDAANSLLVQRLEGSVSSQMPSSGALADSTIDIIKQWINEGASETVSITAESQLPSRFEIVGNYPNPFNLSTRIVINTMTHVQGHARIVTVSGRLVYDFGPITLKSGSNSLVLTGKNYRGNTLSSGIYFFILNHDDLVMTHRMILLK
jgi:hypothetical protein